MQRLFSDVNDELARSWIRGGALIVCVSPFGEGFHAWWVSASEKTAFCDSHQKPDFTPTISPSPSACFVHQKIQWHPVSLKQQTGRNRRWSSCNGRYPSIRASSGSNDDITAIQGRKEITASSAITRSQSPRCPSSFRSGYYSLPKGRTVTCSIPESIGRMKVPSPPLPFLLPKPGPPSRR